MRLKKITLDKLYDTRKGISLVIEIIEKAINTKPIDFEEVVCKRYIEIQNVSKVAAQLNQEGYRIENRKIIGKDISKIIKENEETELGRLANLLFKNNNVLQNGNMSFEKAIKNFKELKHKR